MLRAHKQGPGEFRAGHAKRRSYRRCGCRLAHARDAKRRSSEIVATLRRPPGGPARVRLKKEAGKRPPAAPAPATVSLRLSQGASLKPTRVSVSFFVSCPQRTAAALIARQESPTKFIINFAALVDAARWSQCRDLVAPAVGAVNALGARRMALGLSEGSAAGSDGGERRSVAPPQRRRSAAENFQGNHREKFCAAMAGVMSGGVGVIVGQPFDMLKVRLCVCRCAPPLPARRPPPHHGHDEACPCWRAGDLRLNKRVHACVCVPVCVCVCVCTTCSAWARQVRMQIANPQNAASAAWDEGLKGSGAAGQGGDHPRYVRHVLRRLHFLVIYNLQYKLFLPDAFLLQFLGPRYSDFLFSKYTRAPAYSDLK